MMTRSPACDMCLSFYSIYYDRLLAFSLFLFYFNLICSHMLCSLGELVIRAWFVDSVHQVAILLLFKSTAEARGGSFRQTRQARLYLYELAASHLSHYLSLFRMAQNSSLSAWFSYSNNDWCLVYRKHAAHDS